MGARARVVGALGALVLAAVLPGAARPAVSGRSAATSLIQFVVGTNRLSDGSSATAYQLRFSDPADFKTLGLATNKVTLRGPAGWNGGAPYLAWCAQSTGEAPTMCGNEPQIIPLPGVYTLTIGTSSFTASMSDTTLAPPPTVTAAVATASGVAVSWTATTTGGFAVDIENDAGVIDYVHVSPTARSYVFGGRSFKPGKYYTCVIGYPIDTTTDQVLPQRWNVTSACYTFHIAASPTAAPKRIRAQVHGGATYAPGGWRVSDLNVQNVPADGTVTFRCLSGCSLHAGATAGGTIHLGALGGQFIRIGAKALVIVTKSGYVGFYARLTFFPRLEHGLWFAQTTGCLAPNSTKPVSCNKYGG